MSTFLINASNLKNGGGLQVADSICRQLHRFQEHFFFVVLSSQFAATQKAMEGVENVKCVTYDLKDDWRSLLLGQNRFLDRLVEENHIDAVLTVFGPSRWRPRVPHLCGFARAQLINDVNPNVSRTFKERLTYAVWRWGFRRSSDTFYTENAYISAMLPKIIPGAKVYTVTNYYNQVFDQPENWKRNVNLNLNLNENDNDRSAEGRLQGKNLNEKMVTMLTVSSTAVHKNLGIMVPVSEYLERVYPDFRFRFVLTCDEAPFPLPEHLRKHFVFIGKVDVAECPNLYEQAGIMFMPTLMECFTATYPEAMRMEVPIVTTDLEFARGLCGDAACYYSAMDAEAAAEAIYKVAIDEAYRLQLTACGKEQLKKFDNYEQRAEKLVGLLEAMASKR